MTGMVQPDLPKYKEDIDDVSMLPFVSCFVNAGAIDSVKYFLL